MNWKNSVICMVLAVLVLLTALTQETRIYAAELLKLPSGVEKGELSQRIDQFVREHEDTTVGMAVAVFDGTDGILKNYYGCIDKENKIPVSQDSVFEWGSATKLLVWISVMQLYEQGRIRLDENICAYLPEGFLKNLSYDTPVTMLNLMNHDAGFQEGYVDLMVKEPDYFENLEEALRKHEPAQIYEPGTVTAYSNWGTALAGFIVERVAGMPFYEYVHENIFKPLQMEHSAVSADLSDNEWVQRKRKELQCYTAEGELIQDCFYYITLYPAGMCTSTLDDFERFAAALLREDTALLKYAETWEELFSPSAYFGTGEIPLNCHGMWAVPFGVQTVGHGGNTVGCSSYLLLDKGNDVGAVVMTNQAGETVYNTEMMQLIFGKYERSKYTQENEMPAGIYRTARTVRKGAFKFMSFGYANEPDDDELWIWSKAVGENSGRDKIVYSYGDWVRVPVMCFVFEVGLVLLWAAAVGFSAVFLLIRLIMMLVRKIKKKAAIKHNLGKWSVAASFLQMTTVLFLALIIRNVSNCAMGYTYVWMFAMMGVVALAMSAMCIYAVFHKRNGGVRIREKVLYFTIGVFMMVTVVNVLYWNLFMFWIV